MSFIFQYPTVPISDLYPDAGLMTWLSLALTVAFYKKFLMLSFAESLEQCSMPVDAFFTCYLLFTVALTVSVLIRVVGMILLIRHAGLPAAMARQFTHDIWKMMILFVVLV
jgi:zinc transport system permease protein